jgi:hypothetical protein
VRAVSLAAWSVAPLRTHVPGALARALGEYRNHLWSVDPLATKAVDLRAALGNS